MPHTAPLAGLALATVLALSTSAHALTPDTPACNHAYALGTMGALACSGSWDGNDVNQQAGVLATLASAFASFTGSTGTWSYVGTTKAGESSGPFSSVPAAMTGTLILDAPIQGHFAVALKSSTNFSFYLYDGGPTGLGSIPFTTVGTSINRNMIEQRLSHASLYSYTLPPTHGTITTPVPEPGTYALMLAGLGLVGYAVRRRRS